MLHQALLATQLVMPIRSFETLISRLFQDNVGGSPWMPGVCHGLGPRDMSLEAKLCGHGAVAIPEIRIGGGIAVSPRQQCQQPQQPDVAYSQTLIGWRGGKPLDCGLGFGHVTLGPAIEQCLHQNTRRRKAPPQQLSLAGLDGRRWRG